MSNIPTLPSPEIMTMLQKAYQVGELQITKVAYYIGPKGTVFPDPGCVLYRIYYVVKGRVVYNGCYQMRQVVKEKLLEDEGMLQAFICLQLAPKITS